MTASPRPCSTENWTPVIEHGEDNESGTRTCLRQHWSHAAFHTTHGRPPRQTALWHSTCHSGLRDYEEKRCDALRDKRTRWKAIQPSTNIDTFVCHVCGWICASRIGLHSHNRTHANTTTDWGRDPSYRWLTSYIHTYIHSTIDSLPEIGILLPLSVSYISPGAFAVSIGQCLKSPAKSSLNAALPHSKKPLLPFCLQSWSNEHTNYHWQLFLLPSSVKCMSAD